MADILNHVESNGAPAPTRPKLNLKPRDPEAVARIEAERQEALAKVRPRVDGLMLKSMILRTYPLHVKDRVDLTYQFYSHYCRAHLVQPNHVRG